MFYTVYKITNWFNGKIYIGVHKTDDLDDSYMGSGKHLKYAQEKYGLQYFTKEYLAIFDNPDDMYEMESSLVNEEFIEQNATYNIKEGGLGGWNYVNNSGKNLYVRTSDQYKRIESLKYIRQKHLDKLKDDEYRISFREKVSNGLKEKYKSGFQNGFYGHSHAEDIKIKISSSLKGKNTGKDNSQYGRVRCVPIDATTCKNHVGYFPDQIPEGWITTKEWKDKNKIKNKVIKPKITLDKFSEKCNNAYCWYDLFLSSNSKSLREFVQISNYPYSVVSLSKMFKTYIDEYEPIQGKSYNF